MSLTKKQAYLAMFYYLENLYELTHSDELGGMLGGMTLLENGEPIDSAVWSDWEKAVLKVQSSNWKEEATLKFKKGED